MYHSATSRKASLDELNLLVKPSQEAIYTANEEVPETVSYLFAVFYLSGAA